VNRHKTPTPSQFHFSPPTTDSSNTHKRREATEEKSHTIYVHFPSLTQKKKQHREENVKIYCTADDAEQKGKKRKELGARLSGQFCVPKASFPYLCYRIVEQGPLCPLLIVEQPKTFNESLLMQPREAVVSCDNGSGKKGRRGH
jgi:hypothetical protein